MPANKSKRAASRQAQLRDRSRHNRGHGPSGIPLPYTPEDNMQGIAVADGVRTDGAPGAAPASPFSARRVQGTRQPRGRYGVNVLPPQAYFGREMRRIAIVVALITALLITLTLILK